jgi:hypothetical protein
MEFYQPMFDRAIARLGWRWAEVDEPHDRDDSSSREEILLGPDGNRLIGLRDLSKHMVAEIIRIAQRVSP